jgi:hypothetical protein
VEPEAVRALLEEGVGEVGRAVAGGGERVGAEASRVSRGDDVTGGVDDLGL